ncbi:MFS transporter [Micromonospora sp. LOL_024]|uniref:MFS transporter n=1 Tax=Micromonospora sp. LOL_024 TaxID=3345412 RepID=UPI003A8A42ED
MTARPPTTVGSTRNATPVRSGPGWRLGLLYGPAVYGVSAAAVALPDAARHLQTDGPGLAWILTAYAAGVGVGAVTAGRLTDLRGSRPVLLAAAILLITGALVCAAAPTLPAMVTGRVLLAVGSGTVMATAITSAARLPAARRPAALAAFGACLAGFSATAPLAGAVAAHGSWRAALVLPVLSLAAAPLCWPLLTRPSQRQRVDWVAAGLLAAVAAGLLITAQTAAALAATATMVITAAATVAAAAGLVVRVRARRDGFLPPGILTAAWFRRAAAAGAGVYAGLFAVLYAGPHLLIGHGYSTMDIAVLLLPCAVISALLARAAAQAARRVPTRHVLAAVSLLLAAVILCTATNPQPWTVAAASTAALTASAVAQTLLTAQTTVHVNAEACGGAIGLLTLAVFLGGGCGAAMCAALGQTYGPSVAFTAIAVWPAVGAAVAWRRGVTGIEVFGRR